MGILSFWKKNKEPAPTEPQRQSSPLKRLCEGDPGLYDVLTFALRLNVSSMPAYDELMARARSEETPLTIARSALSFYKEAGSRALYDGNVDGVREAFGIVAETEEGYRPIAENPQKAVDIAKAYYGDPDIKRFMDRPVKTGNP